MKLCHDSNCQHYNIRFENNCLLWFPSGTESCKGHRKEKGCDPTPPDPQKPNQVEHPPHYTAYPVEVIDMIKLILGDEGYKAYCLGNEIKYRMRAGLKNDGQEDLAKAMQYKKFREDCEK